MTAGVGVPTVACGNRRLLALQVALSLACVGATVVGVGKAVSMASNRGGAHSMPMGGHTGPASHRLTGMPLAQMPEMAVAALAVVGVIAVTALAGRSARSPQLPTGRAAAGVPSVGLRRAQLVACTAALSIDVSKTSSLGFVIPGMRSEYGLEPSQAALLAVFGLSGTLLGATAIRTVGHRWARRDVYLTAALGFTATSACGMMPTFEGNLVMCLLMGMSVGGLAPLLVGCLRDLSSSGPRSGLVVGAALVSSAVGFLVAAGSAAWLEPRWGWRAIWLVGAPTGIVLLLATPLFAIAIPTVAATEPSTRTRSQIPLRWQYAFAVLAGAVAFGVSTWTPTLAQRGIDPRDANLVLVGVSAVLVPMAVVLGLLYQHYGPGSLNAGLALLLATALGALLAAQLPGAPSWLPAIGLAATLFAVNAMSAVLMPVAADTGDGRARTQTASTVSMFNRVGGLTGPLVLALLVTSTPRMLAAVSVMAVACGLAGLGFGHLGRRARLVRADAEPAAERSGGLSW